MRKKIKDPDFEIKVYPESKYLYFTVCIWKHKKDMLEFVKSYGMRGKCEAVCMGIRRECAETQALLPHCGVICFHTKYMPYPAIVHEFGHAALEWGRRKRMKIDMEMNTGFERASDHEERILHTQSKMLFEFYEKFHPWWKSFKKIEG